MHYILSNKCFLITTADSLAPRNLTVQILHTKCPVEPLASSETDAFNILIFQDPITGAKQAMNTMNTPWLFLRKCPNSFHNPPKTNTARYFTATPHFWHQFLPTCPS